MGSHRRPFAGIGDAQSCVVDTSETARTRIRLKNEKTGQVKEFDSSWRESGNVFSIKYDLFRAYVKHAFYCYPDWGS